MSHVSYLRQRTNYPVLRGVVRAVMAFAYAGAALLIAVAFFQVMAVRLFPAVVLFAAAPVLVLLAHLTKELATMVADIADATIAMSEAQAEANDPPAANLDW